MNSCMKGSYESVNHMNSYMKGSYEFVSYINSYKNSFQYSEFIVLNSVVKHAIWTCFNEFKRISDSFYEFIYE